MTTDKLTIKEVENLYNQERDTENEFTTNILEQLADTMRENERLRARIARMEESYEWNEVEQNER